MINIKKTAIGPTQFSRYNLEKYQWVGCFYQLKRKDNTLFPVNYIKLILKLSIETKTLISRNLELTFSILKIIQEEDLKYLIIVKSDSKNQQISEVFNTYEIFSHKDFSNYFLGKIKTIFPNYNPDKSLIL